MKLQPRARAGIALTAAYAVALQALLLAFIAPSADLAGTAALSICASSSHSAPSGPGQAGHGRDCLDACLTGCCCVAPLLPRPARAVRYAPKPLQTLATRFEPQAPVVVGRATAHRSRAPPAL
jgi:hypothetical protein